MVRLAVLMISLWCIAAVAQQSADIYRVEVPVANQSDVERSAAAKATLADVIANVANDAAIVQHPLVRQAINDAPSYLSKFSYVTDSSTTNGGLKVILNYSPQAINKLLQQTQVIVAPSTSQQDFLIRISGIDEFTSFKQIQSLLKTIIIIRRVDLISVDKDVMLFKLDINGDAESLKVALNMSGKLVLENISSPSTALTFHWQN